MNITISYRITPLQAIAMGGNHKFHSENPVDFDGLSARQVLRRSMQSRHASGSMICLADTIDN